MAEITAAEVKSLREATNVSMMECKRALVEAEGDMDKALRLLRERGVAVAAKKASRAANQGRIASKITEDGTKGSLVEVNCETDFVARNDVFIAFAQTLAEKACETDDNLAELVKDDLTDKITELGENIILKRHLRFVLKDTGKLCSYIHLGGKVGVLLELGCEKPETTEQPALEELAKDLTMHIAACNPSHLNSDEVPQDVINSEREIYKNQVKDKPDHVIDKIVDGKVKKFFAEVCLVEQGFVKEPKQTVQALLDQKGKDLGDTVVIRRFARFQLGE